MQEWRTGVQVALALCCLVLSGCLPALAALGVIAEGYTEEKWRQEWRDRAAACYQAVQQGQTVTYQARSGVAACDRYVDDMRYEEQRREAERRAREQQHSPQPSQTLTCTPSASGRTLDCW